MSNNSSSGLSFFLILIILLLLTYMALPSRETWNGQRYLCWNTFKTRTCVVAFVVPK